MSQMKGVEVSARAARHIDGYRVLEGKREYVTYQGDSSIRIWYSDIPWRYETHDHSAVEIVLVLEGTVTYSVEGTSYPVHKGGPGRWPATTGPPPTTGRAGCRAWHP